MSRSSSQSLPSVESTPKPAARLGRLEKEYPNINRQRLVTKLEAAIKEQRALNEFIERYAHEARLWKKLSARLTYRHRQALKAVDVLRDELRESRFNDQVKAHLAVRLFELRTELDRALRQRRDAVGRLVAIAQLSSVRFKGGLPRKTTLIDACLKNLVDEVERMAAKMGKEERLDYVAALAQTHACELFVPENAKTPVAALRNRLKAPAATRLTRSFLKRFRAACLSTLEEMAPETYAVAIGEWPARRGFDSLSHLDELEREMVEGHTRKSRRRNASEEN